MRKLLKDPEQQKMYEHIIGMFIVTWFLLMALFVVGCKERYNKVICPNCEKEYGVREDVITNFSCLKCGTVCGYCPHIGWFGEPNSCEKARKARNEPEPDEPEDTISVIADSSWIFVTGLDEPQKVSLDFIPTWPDYIELEKDFIIEEPLYGGVSGVIRKGTKIYFKD